MASSTYQLLLHVVVDAGLVAEAVRVGVGVESLADGLPLAERARDLRRRVRGGCLLRLCCILLHDIVF